MPGRWAVTICALALFVTACAPNEPEDRKPTPNCRVPVDPGVTFGVSVGTSGVKTGGAVVIDASGNNGVLDETGKCVLVEEKSKVTVGIGF